MTTKSLHWSWDSTVNSFQTLESADFDFPNALLWGYSVFTSFRYPLPDDWLALHCQRLFQHAQAIGFIVNDSECQLDEMTCLESLKQFLIKKFLTSPQGETRPSTCSIRLTLYPEVQRLQALTETAFLQKASWQLLLSEFPAPPLFLEDVTLVLEEFQRPLNDLKHGNYLEEFMLLQQAYSQAQPLRPQSPVDVLRVNPLSKALEEASTSNLFLFQQDASDNLKVITPSQRALKGIIQQEIIQWTTSQGIEVIEKEVYTVDLTQTTGVFLSNSGSLLKSVSHWLNSGSHDINPIVWSQEAQQVYETLKAHLISKIAKA